MPQKPLKARNRSPDSKVTTFGSLKSCHMKKEELIQRNKDLEELVRLYEETNRDLRKLLALKERQTMMQLGSRQEL